MNPTQLFIATAFAFAIPGLFRKERYSGISFLILLVLVGTEILCVLDPIKRNGNYQLMVYMFSAVIHNSLWIFLLLRIAQWHRTAIVLIPIYWVLCVLFYFRIISGDFNNIIVSGAFLYLTLFLVLSFKKLQQEDFYFFESRTFLLLFAPVMFFFGMSFLLSFNSLQLYQYQVIGNIRMYNLINYSISFLYALFFISYFLRKD